MLTSNHLSLYGLVKLRLILNYKGTTLDKTKVYFAQKNAKARNLCLTFCHSILMKEERQLGQRVQLFSTTEKSETILELMRLRSFCRWIKTDGGATIRLKKVQGGS